MCFILKKENYKIKYKFYYLKRKKLKKMKIINYNLKRKYINIIYHFLRSFSSKYVRHKYLIIYENNHLFYNQLIVKNYINKKKLIITH